MNRLGLLALLNVIDCHCSDCMWQQVNDIADGLESGDIVARSDADAIVGLFMSQSGAALLRSTPLLRNAAA
jgi:hypothetical protein